MSPGLRSRPSLSGRPCCRYDTLHRDDDTEHQRLPAGDCHRAAGKRPSVRSRGTDTPWARMGARQGTGQEVPRRRQVPLSYHPTRLMLESSAPSPAAHPSGRGAVATTRLGERQRVDCLALRVRSIDCCDGEDLATRTAPNLGKFERRMGRTLSDLVRRDAAAAVIRWRAADMGRATRYTLDTSRPVVVACGPRAARTAARDIFEDTGGPWRRLRCAARWTGR